MSTTISGHIGRDHYQVEIRAGKNMIIADESEVAGGKNEGFDPYELFAASLAACTCATVRMYADRKEMNLEEIHINITLERDEEKNETNIDRNIEFIGDLTTEDKKRLMEVANKCPVHKMMSYPINVRTEVNL